MNHTNPIKTLLDVLQEFNSQRIDYQIFGGSARRVLITAASVRRLWEVCIPEKGPITVDLFEAVEDLRGPDALAELYATRPNKEQDPGFEIYGQPESPNEYSVLLDILAELRSRRIRHVLLDTVRPRSVCVTAATPASIWEIEVFEDGNVEVEVFHKVEPSGGPELLAELIATYSESGLD